MQNRPSEGCAVAVPASEAPTARMPLGSGIPGREGGSGGCADGVVWIPQVRTAIGRDAVACSGVAMNRRVAAACVRHESVSYEEPGAGAAPR